MEFKLEIKLDNAEVAECGIDNSLPAYLMQAAFACQNGSADAGIVRDGNGNTIGKWIVTGGE